MIKLYLYLSRYLTVFLVCISSLGFAQQATVSGKVTAADDGSPVPGANVLEKGTNNGTVTDTNGEFKISVSSNATLSVSFVGYKTQEIVVGNQATVNVVLESDITSLSEVVIVGYGQQEKKDVTGVVVSVGEKNFNKGVIVSPDQLLNGKIAGVQITPADGQPGSGGNVRIRGGTSLNASNEPLYVIDGFPVVSDGTPAGRNPLNFINPNDIETFTVLKDASAAAIYGSRAANGVVVITTKKGKKGAPTVTYDGYFSSSTVAKKYDVFNADQFRSLVTYWAPQNLQYLGDNSNTDVANKSYNTNWQNQIFRQAPANNHNLTISGGSDKTTYRFSVGHLEQQGIINTSYTKKTSIGLSLTQLLFNDDLKIDVNIKGARTEDRFSPSVIGDALQFDPTHPVYDNTQSKFGGYYEYYKYDNLGNRIPVMQSPTNPVSNLNQTSDIGHTFRTLGNIQLDYKIKYVPGLRAIVNLGYDVTTGERRGFLPSTLKFESTPDTGKVTIQNPYKYSRLFEGYFNYKKEIATDHKIDVTAGYSWQDFYSENYGFNSVRLGTNTYGYNNPQVSKQTIPFNPDIQLNRLISFYGRVNYSFKDKYLLTANIRRDGSTRFGPLNKWGTFPSIAAGWRLINESFMQNLQNVFSDLKLRAGYGVVGNQDGIGNYTYLPSYSPSDGLATYPLGSTYYTTIRPSGYDNNLKWEQTATANLGLDFGVLGGRVTGSLEVYQKNTSQLLFIKAVAPGANLTNQILSNIGKMQNQGVELTLNAVAIDKKDLRWDVSFNAAYNKNTIKVLDGDPSSAGYLTGGISGGVGNKAEILKVGQPVNSFYVYQHKTGSDGNPVGDNFGNGLATDMYVDQNNDGQINEKDLRPYKKPLPDLIMGFTSNLSYKNWDLAFTLRSNLGNYNYNNIASGASFKNLADNFWPRNMTTQVLKTTYYTPQYFSDYFVQKASFLRMDNITLGYNVSKISNTNLKVRLYGTIQNAFVITKYRGLDPEIAVNTGTTGTAGIDNNLYPRARTFTVGIRVGF